MPPASESEFDRFSSDRSGNDNHPDKSNQGLAKCFPKRVKTGVVCVTRMRIFELGDFDVGDFGVESSILGKVWFHDLATHSTEREIWA
jgi:hypothetical protein